MLNVAVVDIGTGNLRSVCRALDEAAKRNRIEASIARVRTPEEVKAADKIVVPGQGAFGDCMRGMSTMKDAVRESIASGKPYFGICLGLQVLFERSDEDPGVEGLAILRGGVTRLTAPGLKLPHIGWNAVVPREPSLVGKEDYFYFVHSYAVRPEDASIVAATTDHGETFVSAVSRDNVFGCQFHPEKSQAAGLDLLGRFLVH